MDTGNFTVTTVPWPTSKLVGTDHQAFRVEQGHASYGVMSKRIEGRVEISVTLTLYGAPTKIFAVGKLVAWLAEVLPAGTVPSRKWSVREFQEGPFAKRGVFVTEDAQ